MEDWVQKSPKFGFEIQRDEFQEINSMKNKTMKEIGVDFEMDKSQINCSMIANTDFFGWGNKDIMGGGFMKLIKQINWG